jgi:hypothetical protein
LNGFASHGGSLERFWGTVNDIAGISNFCACRRLKVRDSSPTWREVELEQAFPLEIAPAAMQVAVSDSLKA